MSHHIDRVIGIVLLVASLGLLAYTRTFPSFNWDPVGMALWPRILLVLLAAFSVFHIWRGNVGHDAVDAVHGSAFMLFVCLGLYTLAIGVLGFYPSTLLGGFAYSLSLSGKGRAGIVSGALVAITATVLIYLLFELALGIEMPKGWWF